MSHAEKFWDDLYAKQSPESSGRPSAVLVRFAESLSPGRELDLGCARGDDVVWLARRGWDVVGVDISESVLSYARENAHRAGIDATFARHDLATSLPHGTFDLVTAFYLQSPVSFPRHAVLSRATESVRPGGLFLSVSHGSTAPWSWDQTPRDFPTAQEEREALALDASDWEEHFVGTLEREASGPGGQIARVVDTVVALRRRDV